ncbi:MAG TPA: hypothetical protein VIV57_15500 [Anaeromyxobacter sp.]
MSAIPTVEAWTAELDAEFDRLAGELREALRAYPGSSADDLARCLGKPAPHVRRELSAGEVRALLEAVGAVESRGRWYLRSAA